MNAMVDPILHWLHIQCLRAFSQSPPSAQVHPSFDAPHTDHLEAAKSSPPGTYRTLGGRISLDAAPRLLSLTSVDPVTPYSDFDITLATNVNACQIRVNREGC